LRGPVAIPKIFNGRNKLFFTSNFDELRDRLTTQVNASVATNAMRNGDFSQAGRNIFDPQSRVSATPFPNSVIPQSRLNPISIKMLAHFPAPNQPGTAAGAALASSRPSSWAISRACARLM
jgi:hypothetical protein